MQAAGNLIVVGMPNWKLVIKLLHEVVDGWTNGTKVVLVKLGFSSQPKRCRPQDRNSSLIKEIPGANVCNNARGLNQGASTRLACSRATWERSSGVRLSRASPVV